MTNKEETIKALRARIMGLEKENWELKEQNKRYREALEAIAYFDDKEEGKVATRIDVKYIAHKALEGEDYE